MFTTAAHAAPAASTVLWSEDFQNTTKTVALTSYIPAGSTTAPYTADAAWLPPYGGCNGEVLSASASDPGLDPGCERTNYNPSAYVMLQQMATALGQAEGMSNPSSNFALSEFTNLSSGAQQAGYMFKTPNNVATATPGHFYNISAYFAATNCQAANPASESFYLMVNGQQQALSTGLNPCSSGSTVTVAGNPVQITQLQAGAFLVPTAAPLGVQLYNATANGNGNDVAFDKPMIVDVTPQLSKSFSPSTILAGDTSTMTFTLNNTADNQVKNGWSFTDSLPAGVTVASTPNPQVSSGCSGSTVTASAGSGTVTVSNGKLSGASCTISVNVTASNTGTYTNAASNFTSSTGVLLPTSPATLTVVPPSSISGTVWSDQNLDGLIGTNEPDVSGVTVTLTGTDTNGNAVKLTTTTGNNGQYSFNHLRASNAAGYTVTFTKPATYTSFTQQGVGSDASLNSSAIPATGATAPITLTQGQNDTTVNAGLVQNALVGGVAWNDTNQNGVKDAGESPLSGIKVTITDSTGATVATATTAADGTWSAPVPATTAGYTVTYSVPSGATISPKGTDPNAAIDSTVDPTTGSVATGPLTSGASNTTLNAGLSIAAAATKTASPASGTVVHPGDPISWTLTFDNSKGTIPASVNDTDDLSKAIDDATVTMPTASSPSGLTITPASDGKSFTVTGSVPAGQIMTVTVNGTVKAGGDGTLQNNLLPTGQCTGGSCPTPPNCGASTTCTVNPVSEFTVSKAASTDAVQPGGKVTYTVTVTNTGGTSVNASFNDDLTNVVNNAVLQQPYPSGASYNSTTHILSWSGNLAVGGVATVQYTVQLNNTLPNNASLVNAVTPGKDGSCAGACTVTTGTSGFMVSKTASESVAQPGDTVTYTVNVTATGTAPAAASFTDNLSGVLNNATFPTANLAPGLSFDNTTDILSWSGTVQPGKPVQVTYQVKVNSALASPTPLKNAVVPGAGGNCDPNGTCTTTTDTAGFTVSKSVSPTTATPGQPLTYTVHVASTGSTTVNASFSDNLSGVLSNASDPTNLGPGLSFNKTTGVLSWTGQVSPNNPADVSYTVQVNPTLTGTKTLTNTVTPGTDGTCVTAAACSITTATSGYTITKTASEAVAKPGDTVTYTVNVVNTGSTDVAASFTDDLSGVASNGVLDTADLGQGLSFNKTTNILSWSGTVPAGGSVPVTYDVHVNSALANSAMVNKVTPGQNGLCLTQADCTTTTGTSGFTVSKTADKTTANPGDTVTYTVVVTGTGSVATQASFTDDLSGVLDNATGPLNLGTGASFDKTTNILSWSGTVQPGVPTDVTYQVKVDPALTAAVPLSNKVTPGGSGICDPNGTCSTSTGTNGFTVSKSVSATTAVAGQPLTYTVHVANTGSESVNASFSDNLSQVMQYATLGKYDQGVSFNKATNVLSWSGTLAAGGTQDVHYTVNVNSTLPATPTPLQNSVTPGGIGICDPNGTCSTSTGTSGFTVSKTASSATAVAGQPLQYTVHVVATGTDPANASFSDNLTNVLTNASLVRATLPAGASFDDTTDVLSWSGTVIPGQPQDVVYTVQVNNPVTSATLTNAVAPGQGGTCASSTSCAVSTPTSGYTVSKTVDSTSAVAGAKLTYTVTLTGTGSAPTTTTFKDNLSGVLANATIDPTTLGPGLSYSDPDQTLTWSGTVPAAGQPPVTVTYFVMVDSTVTASSSLINAVTPGVGGLCATSNSCTVTTGSSGFTVSKSVSADTAVAGQPLTYTVHVASTGSDPVNASFQDDLSQVMQYATLGNYDKGVSFNSSNDVLSWNGTLAAGATLDVHYTVNVNSTLPATPTPLKNSVTPGAGGICDPNATCSTSTGTSGFTVSKSVSPTTAVAGQTLTYSVHVVATGTDPVTASFSDDLTNVLGNASFNDKNLPADESYNETTHVLTWTGTVTPGQPIDVPYTVQVNSTVNATPLTNSVTPLQGGTCASSTACSITTPTSGYTVSKSADATSAVAGSKLTYTVTLTGTGSAPSTASFTDNLSKVLTNATFDPNTAGAGLSWNGSTQTLTWNGTVPAAGGKPVTVTYFVTVDNTVTASTSLTNSVSPGQGGTCASNGTCSVTTGSSGFTVSKSVSSDTAVAGQPLTYTVHVASTGNSPVNASFSDDLSQVMQYATMGNYDNGASFDSSTNVLSWNGTLPANGTLDVHYTVNVNSTLPATPTPLVNSVTPGAGGTCDPNATCTTTTGTSGFTVSKSVSASAAVAGQTLTYTVHVAATGTDPANASFSDDLTKVLQNATFDDSKLPSDESYNRTTHVLSWTGTVAPGQPQDVVYTVQVNNPVTADPLVNAVTPGQGGTCAAGGTCSVTTPTNGYTVSKTADATSAEAGSKLTYTVTVTGTGSAPSPASFQDNLSGVLANATFDPNTAGAGLSWNGTTQTLTWNGTAPAAGGTPVTVTYFVTVKDALTAAASLNNSVTPGNGGSCASSGSCSVTTGTNGFTVSKSVSPSVAVAGQPLTYTVHVAATGTDPANAGFTDDLSGVMANATFDNATLPSGASYNDTTHILTWNGTVAPGPGVDVVYQVNVNKAVTATPLTNSVKPDTGGTCDPNGTCTTTTGTSGYTVTKTASETVAKPGDTLTYTVVVAATGSQPSNASFQDDLTNVLNNATISDAALAAAGLTRSGNIVSWSGTVAPGKPATVTYSVQVDSPLAAGTSLNNAVTPGNSDGGSCATPTSCSTSTPTSGFTVSKTASESVAQPGDTVTYSVLVTSTGSTTAQASFTDDLSGVLNNATVTATDPGVTVAGTTLSWSGAVDPGKPLTIHYSVKVDPSLTAAVPLVNSVTAGPGGSCGGTCTTTTQTSGYTVSKTADKAVVDAGGVLNYTVRVVATGTQPANATFTDDLSKVLTNASFNDKNLQAGLSWDPSTDKLTWTGTVTPGTPPVTVQYSVTVNSALTGTAALNNAVTPGQGGACASSTACSVTTDTSGYTLSKTASPANAGPGDVVTYTVHVASTGTAPANAGFTDDLTNVVDNATLDTADLASQGLTYNDSSKLLTWSGTVPANGSVDVTYKATLNNSLTDSTPLQNAVAPTPSTGGSCATGTSCTTSTGTRGLSLQKTVSPSGAVGPNQVVTYTLVIDNPGTADYTASQPATVVDDLSGVLGSSSYNNDVKATAGTVNYVNNQLVWKGALAAGTKAIVTYSVTTNGTGTLNLLNVAFMPNNNDKCLDGSCAVTPPTTCTAPTCVETQSWVIKAVDDQDSTALNTPKTTTVLANDIGNGLTVTGLTQPSHGKTVANPDGTITYTPDPNYSGTDTYTYTVTDNAGNTSTATVTMAVSPAAADDTITTPVNTPGTVDVLTNDAGTGLTVTSTSTPADGTVSIGSNGNVTYTPKTNYSGPDTFTYTETDGGGNTQTATVHVTVTPTAADDTQTTPVNTPVKVSVLANDYGSGLTPTAGSASHGEAAVNKDGTITYTPDQNYSGPDSFKYTDTDAAGQTVSATVTITVTPVAGNDTDTTPVNTPVTVSVLANDAGSSLVPSVATQPSHGTAQANADGTITYTPDPGYSGPDSFTYTDTDAANQTVTATVNITVTPTAANDTATTTANTPTAPINVLANDAGSSLKVTTDQPANGKAVVNSDGTITYTPNANYSGPDSFTYTDTDAANQTVTATVNVTVTPTAANDTATTTANTPTAPINVLANDAGSSLKVTTDQPANGKAVVNSDGTITYTPNPGYSGPDSFTYTDTDAAKQTVTATVNVTVAPTAANDQKTTPANTAVSVPVLSNDAGSSLIVDSVTQPANGGVVINSDNSLEYTPNTDYSGTDTFTYTDKDASGQTVTATVTIDVTPVAVNDTTSTTPNTPVDVPVLSNDHGSSLTVTNTSSPSHGTVQVHPDGTITYSPDHNYSGPDSFTYTATDASGQTTTATVNVTVGPVAGNDTVTTPANTPAANIPVLSNDIGSDLKVTTDQPANGKAVVNPDGTITYTPNPGYSGPDSFTYTDTDASGQTVTATVNVTVVPTAANDTATTPANTATQPINVLANDAGSSLTVTTDQPSNGKAVVNPDGTITYTPNDGYSGPDSFTYTDTDASGQTVQATVDVTVTPTAGNDSATTTANTPAKNIPVLSNDSGSSLKVTTDQPSDGTATVNPDGTITYTPNQNYSGPDSFTYTDTDASGQTVQATVDVTVTPTAGNDSAATTTNTPAKNIPVLSNDSGSNLTVTTDQPSNGKAVVNPDGTITYTPNDGYSGPDSFTYTDTDAAKQTVTATVNVTVTPTAGNDTATTTANTPAANIPVLSNDAGSSLTVTTDQPSNGKAVANPDGTITYTPNDGYSGPDSFTYTDTDASGQTVQATVDVTVTPTAGNDTVNTPANTPANVPVLSNDAGSDLKVTVDQPANGKATVNPDGTVTYTPNPGYSGPDSFTYTDTDASGQTVTATVSVTVAPTAADDTATTVADQPTQPINVLGNDSGSSLKVTTDQPSNGTAAVNPDGTITYAPNDGYSGPDSFTYTDTDASGQTVQATVKVTVTPIAKDDTATTPVNTPIAITVLGNDIGSSLKVTGVTQPADCTAVINSDGTVTYTPDPGFSGTDSFTYTVTDAAGQQATATVTVTVTPLATNDQATTQVNAAVPIKVLGNDAGSSLTVTDPGQPSHGTAQVAPDGSIIYTPAPNYSGPDSFTYTDTDASGQTTQATVDVTVTPIAGNDNATTTANTPVNVDVLGNDTGSSLAVTDPGKPANGTTATNPDGTITYTPNKDYSGPDSFTYTDTDASGQKVQATVDVIVQPQLTPDQVATVPGTPTLPIPVLSNDHGSDLTITSQSSVSTPSHGTAVLNGDGSITYTPDANYTGPDSFTYTAQDSSNQVATTTVNVYMGSLTLVKTGLASGDASTLGDKINWQIEVTNNGGLPVNSLSVSDQMDPDENLVLGACTGSDGKAIADLSSYTLQPNDSFTCDATSTVTQFDLNAGQSVNPKATVTGQMLLPDPSNPGTYNQPGGSISADGTGVATLNRNASFAFTKTASLPNGETVAQVGDTITYHFVVANNGNQTMTSVVIADGMNSAMTNFTYGDWPDPNNPNVLQPGQSVTATGQYVVTAADAANGTIVNNATVTGASVPCTEPATELVTMCAPGSTIPMLVTQSASATVSVAAVVQVHTGGAATHANWAWAGFGLVLLGGMIPVGSKVVLKKGVAHKA